MLLLIYFIPPPSPCPHPKNRICKIQLSYRSWQCHSQIKTLPYTLYWDGSLVPRPPLFFVLWIAFSVIHESRRAAKNREGMGTLIIPLHPPCVHLTSFMFFATLPVPCIILNVNWRTTTKQKNGGGLGIKLLGWQVSFKLIGSLQSHSHAPWWWSGNEDQWERTNTILDSSSLAMMSCLASQATSHGVCSATFCTNSGAPWANNSWREKSQITSAMFLVLTVWLRKNYHFVMTKVKKINAWTISKSVKMQA